MIAIIDYNIGNLASVKKAFCYLGIDVILSKNAAEIKKADGIILPGVGAFGEGMNNIRKMGLEELILDEIAAGKPLLGICLGMQLLFDKSSEAEEIRGLGLIPGTVIKFEKNSVGKIPQIGWNQLKLVQNDPVFNRFNGNSFYFVHSFYVLPDDEKFIIAKTKYGKTEFVSVVRKNNVWGMQCHPEKSSKAGLLMLKNFCEVVYNGNNSGN